MTSASIKLANLTFKTKKNEALNLNKLIVKLELCSSKHQFFMDRLAQLSCQNNYQVQISAELGYLLNISPTSPDISMKHSLNLP